MTDESLANQISQDAQKLGIRSGGALMIHSSLRALGVLPGGPKALITGLLSALGTEGTLLMPALSYEIVTPDNPVFDLRNTPSNVGSVPEYFRKWSKTIRSLHPTHSVCAYGPLAQKILTEHSLDNTPCGVHSPFRKLPDFNGQILMLGCGLQPNTSIHAIEELVQPEYLFGRDQNYKLIDADGRIINKTYVTHDFEGWIQRYERVAGILPRWALKQGSILKAESFLIDSRALWAIVLKQISQDPLFFVDRIDPAKRPD